MYRRNRQIKHGSLQPQSPYTGHNSLTLRTERIEAFAFLLLPFFRQHVLSVYVYKISPDSATFAGLSLG